MRLVIVGDALLDRDVDGTVERLSPEAPVPVVEDTVSTSRPGGAGLAAALAAADGVDVALVTALAEDEPGRELRALLAAAGVEVVDLGLAGATPQKVRVRAAERLLLRIDHGRSRPAPVGTPTAEMRDAVTRADAADAVLVSDYGRRVAAEPGVRAVLAAAARRVPVVWDPHPRGAEPVRGARLATPNRAEAARLAPGSERDGVHADAERARMLRERWDATAVAITLGREGAIVVERDGTPTRIVAPDVSGGDPCGAGDRFAVTATRLLADGNLVGDAVAAAVAAASNFVAAGGAAAFATGADATRALDPGAPEDAERLAARVRAAGGAVVATGGCFDLLHAGHVSMLEAARSLGDCLIVCLNSDESVRRLKGSDRPLVPEDDRAGVLRALTAVDAVLVFDEDTPEAALERLRPHVFAKGGDYTRDELPEARVVESWGGEVVILPYVAGRSTTQLIAEAQSLGA